MSNKQIKTSYGRWILMLLVLMGTVTSLATLGIVSRGGAISPIGFKTCLVALMKVYVPLLAIMGGFYFAEHNLKQRTKASTSLETFVFSTVVVGLWVLIPPIFLVSAGTYNAAIKNIEAVKLFGDAIAAGAISFYYSKSSK